MRRSVLCLAAISILVTAPLGCGGQSAPSTDPRTQPPTEPPAAPTQAATVAPTSSPAPTQDTIVRDGEAWVVYQWLAGNGDGIYLVRLDGSGQHRLAAGIDSSQIHPDWSPDGSMIAFVSITSDDRMRLSVINADGTDGRELWACELPCNSVEYPDWSADGSSIYVGLTADPGSDGIPQAFQVGRFDLATGEMAVVLERRDGMTAEQPRVSPDDRRVVYTRYKDPASAEPGSAIFVANLAGGKERRLTDFDGYGAYPDWSIDGRIVFNTRDLGQFQQAGYAANLFLVDPDGTNLLALTTFGESDARATQPRWTPDGTQIIFTSVTGTGSGQRSIGIIDADGLGLGSLPGGTGVSATHPALRPLPD